MSINKLNWEVFQENSSSSEAIFLFAVGTISFPELRKQMWDRRAKVEVGKLQRLGRKKALSLTRNWLSRNGYGEYKEHCPKCGGC